MTTPKYDLPTAIRIGAKIRGQTHIGYNYAGGRTCVLGAALEGETGSYLGFASELWPELRAGLDADTSICEAITDLNDKAFWTREEIADWLDVILP